MLTLTLDSECIIGESKLLFLVSVLGVLSPALYCSHEGDPTSIISMSLSRLHVSIVSFGRSCDNFLLGSGRGSALTLAILCARPLLICLFSVELFSLTPVQYYNRYMQKYISSSENISFWI